jgi:hypothetical protein
LAVGNIQLKVSLGLVTPECEAAALT